MIIKRESVRLHRLPLFGGTVRLKLRLIDRSNCEGGKAREKMDRNAARRGAAFFGGLRGEAARRSGQPRRQNGADREHLRQGRRAGDPARSMKKNVDRYRDAKTLIKERFKNVRNHLKTEFIYAVFSYFA